MANIQKISDILNGIKDVEEENGKVSVGAILRSNSENAYFLMVLITIMSFLPFIFVVIFGSLDIHILWQILFKKQIITLPKIINNISLKKTLLIKIIDKINPFILKLEILTKHRYVRVFKKRNMRILHIFIFVLSLIITIPIPLTGTIPAIAMLFLLLGILSRDGLWVIIGIITGIIGILILSVVVFLMRMLVLKIFM